MYGLINIAVEKEILIMGKGKNAPAAEKSLEEMTIKEVRALAMEVPDIAEVHQMNRREMVMAINKSKGIAEPETSGPSLRDLKKSIRLFKEKIKNALDANDKKLATKYRHKVGQLKKKTRQAA